MKLSAERAIMRGAIASGTAYGFLNSSMNSIYDFCKEYMYYWFGPAQWLRPTCLLVASAFGVGFYLPFDNIKVRMHTMTELPDGRMPYEGVIDAFRKIFVFESNIAKHSSIGAFYNGGLAAFCKIYVTLIIVWWL